MAKHRPPTDTSAPRPELELGANLRRLRTRRGLSIERLAAISGVSRAMISQIELGQSSPTINVLWKLSSTLDVTFSTLIQPGASRTATVLRAASTPALANRAGTLRSRALSVPAQNRGVELYELRLAAGGVEDAEAHPPGTVENLVVDAGVVEIELAGAAHRLRAGDAILFDADVPHRYTNPGAGDAVMYLVMTYAERAS